jgi:hypothetical protein
MSPGSIEIDKDFLFGGDEQFDKAYIQSDSGSEEDEGTSEGEDEEEEETSEGEDEEEEEEEETSERDEDDDRDEEESSEGEASIESLESDNPFQVVPNSPTKAASTELNSFTANAGFGGHVIVEAEHSVSAADNFETKEDSEEDESEDGEEEDDEEEDDEEGESGEEFEDEPLDGTGAKPLLDPDIEANLAHEEVLVRHGEQNVLVRRLYITVGCLGIALLTVVILLFVGRDDGDSQSSRDVVASSVSLPATNPPTPLVVTSSPTLSPTTTPTSSPTSPPPTDPPIVAITTDYVIQIPNGNTENIPFETLEAALIKSLDILVTDLWAQPSLVTKTAIEPPTPGRRLGGATPRRRLSTELQLPTKITNHVEVGTYQRIRGFLVFFGLCLLISLFSLACPTNLFVSDSDRCEKITVSIEFTTDGTDADVINFKLILEQDIAAGQLQESFATLDSNFTLQLFVDDSLLPITLSPTMSPTISPAVIAPSTLAPSTGQGTGTTMPSSPSTSAPTAEPSGSSSTSTIPTAPTLSPMPSTTWTPTMDPSAATAEPSGSSLTSTIPTAPTLSPMPSSTWTPTMDPSAATAEPSGSSFTSTIPTAPNA